MLHSGSIGSPFVESEMVPDVQKPGFLSMGEQMRLEMPSFPSGARDESQISSSEEEKEAFSDTGFQKLMNILPSDNQSETEVAGTFGSRSSSPMDIESAFSSNRNTILDQPSIPNQYPISDRSPNPNMSQFQSPRTTPSTSSSKPSNRKKLSNTRTQRAMGRRSPVRKSRDVDLLEISDSDDNATVTITKQPAVNRKQMQPSRIPRTSQPRKAQQQSGRKRTIRKKNARPESGNDNLANIATSLIQAANLEKSVYAESNVRQARNINRTVPKPLHKGESKSGNVAFYYYRVDRKTGKRVKTYLNERMQGLHRAGKIKQLGCVPNENGENYCNYYVDQKKKIQNSRNVKSLLFNPTFVEDNQLDFNHVIALARLPNNPKSKMTVSASEGEQHRQMMVTWKSILSDILEMIEVDEDEDEPFQYNLIPLLFHVVLPEGLRVYYFPEERIDIRLEAFLVWMSSRSRSDRAYPVLVHILRGDQTKALFDPFLVTDVHNLLLSDPDDPKAVRSVYLF